MHAHIHTHAKSSMDRGAWWFTVHGVTQACTHTKNSMDRGAWAEELVLGSQRVGHG